jgi:hypothetical protein
LPTGSGAHPRPSRPTTRPTVSLFEIRSVAGYSYADWTPLIFTLEQLFTDDESATIAEAMKGEFNNANCPRAVVRDFLYLTGDYETGTWNWGGNSRTTAVLLWEDAWSFSRPRRRRSKRASRNSDFGSWRAARAAACPQDERR